VPDDKMAWGSILSVLTPHMGILFLQRGRGPGFRFHIEPKTCMLLRTISLSSLKEYEFNVPKLDESLRLQTNNRPEAVRYFFAPEKQQALTALFLAGFTRLKSDHGAIMVESEKGSRSVFRLFFPVCGEERALSLGTEARSGTMEISALSALMAPAFVIRFPSSFITLMKTPYLPVYMITS